LPKPTSSAKPQPTASDDLIAIFFIAASPVGMARLS
jgi:hypothetical protein